MNTRAPDTLEPAYNWRRAAACATAPDPEIFFADPSQKKTIRQAKAICRRCPVALHCLVDRLEAELTSARYGIWGGATAHQRRLIYEAAKETGEPIRDAAEKFVDRLHREDDALSDAYAQRTEEIEDGHVRLTVVTTTLIIDGEAYTPLQIAFIVAHGRRPNGVVRAHCGYRGCVALDHIGDTAMRKASRQAVAA